MAFQDRQAYQDEPSSRNYSCPLFEQLEPRVLLNAGWYDIDLSKYNLGTNSVEDLVAEYAPVLKMDSGENFGPKDAAIFTRDATMRFAAWDGTLDGLGEINSSWACLDLPALTHSAAVTLHPSATHRLERM